MVGRVLAPIALGVCAVLFFIVVLGSGGEEEKSKDAASTQRPAKKQPRQRTSTQAAKKASYTVKAGDTLAGIAEDTGVSVETIQELNPELDPQALVSGQKIKLRE